MKQLSSSGLLLEGLRGYDQLYVLHAAESAGKRQTRTTTAGKVGGYPEGRRLLFTPADKCCDHNACEDWFEVHTVVLHVLWSPGMPMFAELVAPLID